MFTRSILIPSLVACAIAAPLLFSNAKKAGPDLASQKQTEDSFSPSGFGPNNAMTVGYGQPAQNGQSFGSVQHNPFQTASSSYQNAPSGNPVFYQANAAGNPAYSPANSPAYSPANSPAYSPVQPATTVPDLQTAGGNSHRPTNWPTDWPANQAQSNFAGMTPDFNAAQTIILPGNAQGPDLSAAPLEFVPVSNLAEIFRFDVDSQWIKSRWRRVSTSPGDHGTHGWRVALVTGTNSWDLHGSLTYYFDDLQRVQRITFRGWAGDASRLTNLLIQQHGFKSQPTHWAGFYLAGSKRKPTGGILMQHPSVIYTDNPVQQIAVVMEMNNPKVKSNLSDEFRSLILGSQQSR